METQQKLKDSFQLTKKMTSKIIFMHNLWRLGMLAVMTDLIQNLDHLLLGIIRRRSTLRNISLTHLVPLPDSLGISCHQNPWRKPIPTGIWKVQARAKWSGTNLPNQKSHTINPEHRKLHDNFVFIYCLFSVDWYLNVTPLNTSINWEWF